MSDKCPKCGARMVWFIDYERNDGSGLGLRCVQRCGGQITFADLRRQRDHAQARYDALRITSETTIGQLRQQAKHLEGRVRELGELLPLCKQILEWDEREWEDDGAGFDALRPTLIELRAAYALAARKEPT